MDAFVDLVSGAWWSYLVIFAVAYLDVLIPLVPSETTVITAGVLASDGDLHLWLIIVFAALGATLGDNTAYFLGRYLEQPIRRRFFSSEKGKERVRWAEHQLDERGGELIIVCRFIPGARTAVTVSCGWLEMRWRRFAAFDLLAAVIWASYGALLGYFGGKTFEDSTWKALAVAFGIAFSVIAAIEGVRWVLRRRKAAAASAG